MAVPFPALTPSSRTFTPPRWPVTSSTSQSGVSTVRLWGSQPSEAGLSLSFRNIEDDSAALILESYRLAKGNVEELTLPTSLFDGASALLKEQLNLTAGSYSLRWHFPRDNPPQATAVKPGRSDVSVTLVGELRMY